MGLVKTLKKVFKGRKKRDRDEDGGYHSRSRNQGHHRSIRGGIYEPYRAHFPLKTQQINYDVDQYYSNWEQHQQHHQQQQQQPKFGPKLMTAGPTAPTQNRAQNYSHVAFNGFNSTPTYEQHDFHPQNAYQRANYEQTRIAKFGENNPFQAQQQQHQQQQQPVNLTGHENYDNHQLPNRSSQSFNHGTNYTNHYPNQMQRSGSNASLSAHLNPYNPYTTHVLQRPRRPSSAILPTRSASDVGFMNSRPMRPGSSQGFDLNETRQYRVHSPPVRNNVTSAFDQQRVLSPAPGENPIAAQLRGSQANLQQALRMHEDIARQGGNGQPAPELDATMKIMQTCLDMLDSISGLVESSTTPLPPTLTANFNEKQNFINHLENKQPVKSALKRPPLQKSSNSAFTQLRKEGGQTPSPGLSGEESHSEGYGGGETPSPKPEPEDWSDEIGSERNELVSDFNSPGPSENSVDSGFGKSAKTKEAEELDQVAKKELEQKRARNLAKFESMIRSNQTLGDNRAKDNPGPLLASLSQLRLNA